MILKAKATYREGIIKLYNSISVEGLFDVHDIGSKFDLCKYAINYSKYHDIRNTIMYDNNEHVDVEFHFEDNKLTSIQSPQLGINTETVMRIRKIVSEVYGTTPKEMWENRNRRKSEYLFPRRAVSCILLIIGFTQNEAGKVVGKDHATVLNSIRSAHRDIISKYEGEHKKYQQLSILTSINLETEISNYNKTKYKH
jgi:hypothetical protein